jgi:hypothetical protein
MENRMPRPAKDPVNRRRLLTDGKIQGEVHSTIPGPLLIEVEKEAALEMISVAAFVRRTLLAEIQARRAREDGDEPPFASTC